MSAAVIKNINILEQLIGD